MDRLYYTPREVAEILRVSDDAVLDMIHRDELPALRVSPRIFRIPIAGFDAWRAGRRPVRRRVEIRQASRRTALAADEAIPDAAQPLRR